MKYTYILRHDTPEIKMGAVLEYNPERGRYDVVNLEDVARYPLTSRSYFSFHKDVVEGKPYWFEVIEDDECDCDCRI